ncbi:hypothetical protein HWV62_19281 [Athelia sp. TMB]|nr:hypothetical protein HWV62_19281 [Athelia sp. TMB]
MQRLLRRCFAGISAGQAHTRQHACLKVPQKMQASTSQTPGSYDLESIYQDTLKQLQAMRDQKLISPAHYDLIANTKGPAEIEGVVTASQTQSETTNRVLKVVRPLLEQLERFGPTLDAIAGAAPPQFMGVNMLGIVWGSIKFFMVIARDFSDAFTTICDFFEEVKNSLPVNQVYIDIFGPSELQLLRGPLVKMYKLLLLFGVKAVELVSSSTSTRAIWKSATSSPSNELQNLTAQIVKARNEINIAANAEHMHQSSKASKSVGIVYHYKHALTL